MKHIFLIIFSGGFLYATLAQTGVKGFVRTNTGEILPFATIYIKGTTNGTTCNASADYFLRASAGDHTIIVQHVGYATQEKTVTLANNQVLNLNFILHEQAFQLRTVTISSDDENPAYRVIRGAIAKRKFYENEVWAFKANAYLKGLQRLDKRPDKFLGIKITIDTGIVYLSESVSEFAYERPDKIYERMISSKVSGNDQGFSFNQASDFNVNFYEKTTDMQGISERHFISPISRQAFLFYDYELEGVFEENGKLINKIRLLPKRRSDPVFDGHIYIVEDDWKLHTVDYLVTRSRGIEFADSIRMNQVFAPAQHGIWMPISQRFSFRFKIFGFEGSGYFVGVYSDYEVEPNYELYTEELPGENTGDQQREDLFDETDFSAEVLVVEKESNERDSTYWGKIRPIPLTVTEVTDYHEKDSIRLVKESVVYKDSVDNELNRPTVGNVLVSGFTHYNSLNENYWSLPAVTAIFQFNTVEGFVPEIQPTLWHEEDERTTYQIRPSLRYGTSNKHFNAMVEGNYRKLDDKFTRFYAGGGRYVFQFNEAGALLPFINTITTLASGRNYIKLFEKSFGYFRYRKEVANGIMLDSRVEYASRDTLTNTKTDYYWLPATKVNFTANQPENAELSETGFSGHQALTASFNFRIRFDQRYASRPDGKVLITSGKPELMIGYKKGIKALGSDVNFDFLSVEIDDRINFGLTGTGVYLVGAGSFLNNKSLSFVDFRHFAGNQTSLSQAVGELQFHLLDFYTYSTRKSYVQAHYEHHFNEFIFNKIPLVRKLNFQAVAGVNFLKTDAIGNYFELGAGIEHIFKFIRVDYWWGFRDGIRMSKGFRIGAGF